MPARRPVRPAPVAALTVPRIDDPAISRVIDPIVTAIRDLQRRVSLLENVPEVVAETVVSPLFDTVLTPAQIALPTNNWFPGVFGVITLVRVTTDATRVVTGMVGGVPNAICCLLNVNAVGTNTPSYSHEDTLSLPANRFHNSGGGSKNGQSSGAVWYMYDGASSRWLNIMDTQ
jgi:hypothetical protein